MAEDAGQLFSQQRQLQAKQQLLDRVSTYFSIDQDDRQALTSMNEPVTDRYFTALTRVKRFHQDCRILLGAQHQTLGLDIMDQGSKLLDAAYEKLYRWIHSEFNTLNLESPQLSSLIRRGLRTLAERPTLFQGCMESFAESRDRVLSDAFRLALTGPPTGGVSGAKPIEASAPDPLRYVGDMLAWVHSTTVSEREALEVLFIGEGEELRRGVQEAIENDPWERSRENHPEVLDGTKALNDLVNKILAGVSRLLRQRVEPVISAYDEPTPVYRLANLLSFYHLTVGNLIGREAAIVETLKDVDDSARRHFYALIKDHVRESQKDEIGVAPDLGVPPFLTGALERLGEIMKSYESSFAPVESEGEEGFWSVLSQALDPYLLRCEEMAEEMDRPGKDIFILNCLIAARNEMAPFSSFTSERLAEINRDVQMHVRTVTDDQHTYFLHRSGLCPLVEALVPRPDRADEAAIRSLASLPAFRTQRLGVINQTLNSFLPFAVIDATERLKFLRDPKLVHDITEEAGRRFCVDFELVEATVLAVDQLLFDQSHDQPSDELGPASSLRRVFPRTSAEIQVLLS